MILQLKRLFDRVGEQTDFSGVIPLEELRDLGTSLEFTSPISLEGKIQNIAGMVTLDYSLRSSLLLLCDRCLDEFTKDYDLSFSHILCLNESELTGEDDVLIEDYVLDMNELAVSDLAISLPTKILCSEDCLGLCPDCGGNLNRGECRCQG